jgi:aspartate aminotransferase
MIIAINPDNPTGRLLSSAEVRAIGELAEDNGIGIISDESYYRMLYDGEFTSFQDHLPNLVGIRSFSKTASATGWRIGYNYASLQMIDVMEKVNQFRTLCVAPFFQQMILEFIMDHGQREEYVRMVLEAYRSRRDAMAESLRKWVPEARFTVPPAAFYYFIRLPGVPDDVEFSERIFNETKVAVVPGSAFGMPRDSGYFRLTFVSESVEKIDEGIHRIATSLDEMLEKPRIETGDY